MTLYDRLGVPRSATADELRAAYRHRARQLHPDAGGGSDGAMADLNEAWRVLSDPARRQRYDAELRADDAPAEARDHVLLPPEHRERAGVPRPRGVTWIVVLAVLAGIFVFSAYARGGRDQVEPGLDGRLRPGECVLLPPLRPASEVPCRQPHDGVVLTLVPLAAPCPTGRAAATTPDRLQTVCVRDR